MPRKLVKRPTSSSVSTTKQHNGDDIRSDVMFKVVIIGNTHVGKTSLMMRYADDTFRTKHISTIGVDFKIVNVKIGDTCVKLQIWDTAGQDRFRTISSTYYRGAHGAIVVYDVTSSQSFYNVEHWINDMNAYNQNVYKILVGNKDDDPNGTSVPKIIETNEAKTLAKQLNVNSFETSAKEDINVKEVFEDMAHELLKRYNLRKAHMTMKKDQSQQTIKLTQKQKKKKKTCCN